MTIYIIKLCLIHNILVNTEKQSNAFIICINKWLNVMWPRNYKWPPILISEEIVQYHFFCFQKKVYKTGRE